jgi:DegV family protein with EDD domain
MAEIAVVTDQGCDLSAEQQRESGVVVVPLIVRFGLDVDDDGSLDTDAFWSRVAASPPYPETSQPSPGMFEAAFAPLVEAGRQVVCPLISARLSGTVNAARVAAERFSGQVTVFDTRSLSVGQAFQVLRAAAMARGGHPLHDIVDALERMRGRTSLVIMLDTLDFLRRGGRASALMPVVRRVARALRVRPLLRLVDGELVVLGVSRSRRHGTERLVRAIEAQRPIEALGVAHTRCPEEATALAATVAQRCDLASIATPVVEAGPALASHAGPGVLAVAALRRDA